jgi:hypothetical protein
VRRSCKGPHCQDLETDTMVNRPASAQPLNYWFGGNSKDGPDWPVRPSQTPFVPRRPHSAVYFSTARPGDNSLLKRRPMQPGNSKPMKSGMMTGLKDQNPTDDDITRGVRILEPPVHRTKEGYAEEYTDLLRGVRMKAEHSGSLERWKSPFGTHLPDQTRQVRKRTVHTGSLERWAESGQGHLPKYGRNGISRRIKSHRKSRNTQDRNDSSHAEGCIIHNQEEEERVTRFGGTLSQAEHGSPRGMTSDETKFQQNQVQNLQRKARPPSQRRHNHRVRHHQHPIPARVRNAVHQAQYALPRRMPTAASRKTEYHLAQRLEPCPVWR